MECELAGITVHYEVRGAGTPFLLLHGATLDHRHIMHDFEPLFALHPGWLRIYPDLPGHGQTPAPAWIQNQGHVAEVVLAFVERVIGAQRFAIAGESWGGALAQPVVQRYQRHIDGVGFIVTAASFEPTEDPEDPPPPLIGDAALVARATALDPRAGEVLRWQPVQIPHVLDWWLENSRPAKPLLDTAFGERLWGDPEAGRLAFPPLVEPFAGPALIFNGRQDESTPPGRILPLLEQYPRATVAILDRAGHLAMVQQRALFNALLGEWLDRVEEYQRQLASGLNHD